MRNADVVDDDLGPFLQGWNQRLQDLDTVFVGPIVEDPAKQVDVGLLDGLRRQKVIVHAGYAVFEILRHSTPKTVDRVREILDDAFDVWKSSSDCDANLAVGAADIDDGTVADGPKVEIIDQVVHTVRGVQM